MGNAAASRYSDTVRQSKRMMIFFREKQSASLPPRSAAGKETAPAVAMSIAATPSEKPSLVVKRNVIMGQTKEPMAVTSFPTNRIYISFFNPAYWVRIRCMMVFLSNSAFFCIVSQYTGKSNGFVGTRMVVYR